MGGAIKRELTEEPSKEKKDSIFMEKNGEFDPGSESTLAACLTHASRTRNWEQS